MWPGKVTYPLRALSFLIRPLKMKALFLSSQGGVQFGYQIHLPCLPLLNRLPCSLSFKATPGLHFKQLNSPERTVLCPCSRNIGNSDKLDYIKVKNCSSKTPLRRWKITHKVEEGIHSISDKGSISRTDKEFLKIIKKKTKQHKMGKRTWIDISKEKMS